MHPDAQKTDYGGVVLTMERVMEMTFGEVVRHHRTRLGITQEVLADRLGIDTYRITRVETGTALRKFPSPKELRQWADALEVPVEVMLKQLGYLEEEDAPRPPEMLFTSLAEEIRSADNVPVEVRDTALDGIRQARRMYEVIQRKK